MNISKSDAEFLLGIAKESNKWLQYYWSGEDPKNKQYNKAVGEIRLKQLSIERARIISLSEKLSPKPLTK